MKAVKRVRETDQEKATADQFEDAGSTHERKELEAVGGSRMRRWRVAEQLACPVLHEE